MPQHMSDTYAVLGGTFRTYEVIGVLLFIGAMGKSAQIGLHVWLPDAMEGPTPVSALIHAATMVTAGVFLMARMSPLMEFAPFALGMVTFIGGTTALFAATIGCAQTDIKKVIAYSTCSQLGYMFVAAGVGAFQVSIFHLISHAFFKALLFLSAGSVIHAMSDEQDMRKMGGIWRMIPWTYALMWVGSLALAGIPPFAGYYSKDAIIDAAFANGSGDRACTAMSVALSPRGSPPSIPGACCSDAFHGTSRADHHVLEHVHESPWVMIGAAVGAGCRRAVRGHGAGRHASSVRDWHAFWGASIFNAPNNHVLATMEDVPRLGSRWRRWCSALLGIAVAYVMYIANPLLPMRLASMFRGSTCSC